MPRNKGGRKRLGDEKRNHVIKLRFNKKELKTVREIVASYNLDFEKRGTMGPFLRRLILDKEVAEARKLPGLSANLVYQINKIGTNINQLTTVARAKNQRSPSAKMDMEMETANVLLGKVMELLQKLTG